MFWLSSNHASVFRCFLGFLFLWRFTGNNHLTSATKHSKVKRFMRGMKQLLCFSWCLWVSGSGWEKKPHERGLLPSLYWHNEIASFFIRHRTLFWASRFIIELINNVNLNVSVFKSAFQNLPQRSHEFVLIYPVLDHFFHRFLIDCRAMSIELRAELSFLGVALFMKASSKMKCWETELCIKKEFLFPL